MATAFNTQTGNGEYRLQFETNNKDHFLLMQATARQCIDGKPQTHADQIRAMSDEELAKFVATKIVNVESHKMGGQGHIPTATQLSALGETMYCILMEWLQQPAENPVKWSKPGPCPVTPEQFDTIYNDKEEPT